jgi:hypothetical protein
MAVVEPELKSFWVRVDGVPAVGRHRVELMFNNARLLEKFDHRYVPGPGIECVEIPPESSPDDPA